jgi:GT2 family glycosyltransferase
VNLPAGKRVQPANGSFAWCDARRLQVTADLSIVIPSHHRADLLYECLASVARHAPPGTEVIVVDDASNDGTITKCAGSFAGVRVLRMPRRRGFCAAANLGVRSTNHCIVELLNDDTEVTAGWTEAPLAAFSNPSVGAVAPLVLYWPGGEVGEARIDSAGDRYYRGGIAGKRGHGETLTSAFLHRTNVFGASGSSAFYRRDVFVNVGGLPESFTAYFDDVDLSFRLHWAGFEIVYEPASKVLHHVGSSYRKAMGGLVEQQARNEERVFWRNLPPSDLLRALPAHLAVVAAKAWRRWRAGELRPFLRGRLKVLGEASELVKHRRLMRRFGVRNTSDCWHMEEHIWSD